MITTKKSALIIFSFIVAFIYLWNFLFSENELLCVLGTSIFPILIGLLSAYWTSKTYGIKSGKEKYVWLFLFIGLLTHVLGNVIWLLCAIYTDSLKAPDISYVFWLIAYFMFLLALTYKVRLISSSILRNSYLFNTAVFFIVLFILGAHFLVLPVINSADSPFQIIVIGFLYPLMDIGLLFVVTLLYYLSRHSHEKVVMTFLIGAFYLQVFGDSLTSIMKANKDYYQLFIEPIWVGALLLIGFASLFAQRVKEPENEMTRAMSGKESYFPYISAILLNLLTYHSYQWQVNTLSLGLGLVFFLIIIRHLMILKKNERLMTQYRKLAYHDALTELSNRSSFNLDLERAIQQAEKNNSTLSLLLIDLDRFKMINDTLGHIVGDQLLVTAAQSLKESLEDDCRIYRLGGDEFVVLLKEATPEKCIGVAKQIIHAFNRTFPIDQHEITITPSVGISSYPLNGRDRDSFFKAADAAMYLAKANGRNNYHFYNSELNQLLTRKLAIENELRKAIEKNTLQLYYQPKFNLVTREIMGMEALLRFTSPEIGIVSPNEFIPVAEETGLMVKIGEWVLNEACKQNKEWQDKGYAPIPVAVNVSVQQFTNSNLMRTVENLLYETGLPACLLELEITESIMQDVEESKKVLVQLRELGIKVSLDDFGTGYSSLHVLKNLPINTLKIDKTFIDDITEEDDHSMVKGIIDIANNLNLEIVAEGIEQEHQVKALVNYHCHYGQGYFFARPLPASEIENSYLKKYERI